MNAQRQPHIVEHIHPLQQRGSLEQHPEPTAYAFEFGALSLTDAIVPDPHPPLVRRQQADHMFQSHALARPGRADNDERLAFLNGEIDPVEHSFARQRFDDSFEADHS